MTSFPIHPALSPYVSAVLVQEGGGATGPYRVLPKPYPVIGFQYRGSLSALRGDQEVPLQRAGITGLQREVRVFRGQPDTRSVLVMLRPAGAWALFGVPLDELADAHVGLADMLPATQVREVDEQIATGADSMAISELVQSFLITSLRQRGQNVHPAVLAATSRLMAMYGNVRIEPLTAQLGVGRRQLERLFQLQIGVSPREFAALARFEWAAQQLRTGRSGAELAVEAGYADQAHFIRNFVKRTGQTPRRFADDLSDVAFVQSL